MAMNKRKTTTAIVAGMTAVALVLGGTFAWTSISQQAKNESAGIVNVGGRLHDDFNGTNKDIYVENFTDPLNGGQPIYARIKLTEYMEVGQDAGGFGQDTNGDGKVTAVPVVNNTDINDKDNWSVHIPAGYCEICTNGDTCLIHDHWTWEMGGSTVFMPTFNKDKDSLAADINGTYHGTDDTDKRYYDDYVEYVLTDTEGESDVPEANKADYDKIYSVVGTEYYDDDTDTADNNGTRPVENVTHTAKSTADGTVILMSAWDGTPGNYWVYDEDGWAYWANPIMPGEATGLLLDSIKMEKNPGEKCYYAINVVAQFATVGDWEYFDDFNETDNANALAVLTAASRNIPTVTVTNQDKITLVNRGDEINFSASTVVGSAVSTLAEDEYEWVVLDENRNVTTTSTVEDNGNGTATLKVGTEEMSAGLYVAARSKNYGGAVGLSAVAVQLYTVNISAENNTTVLKAGNTLNFSASVVDSSTGAEETSGVTWSLSGQGENTNTNISQDGVLTIDPNEQGATVLTITATSKNGNFVQTYTVTVADKYTVAVSMVADNDIDPGDKLQFTATVTKNGETDTTSGVNWTVSGGNGKSTISEGGVLTIDASEQGATQFTVTATSKGDSTVSDTLTVTISDQYAVTVSSQLHIDKRNESGVFGTVYIDSPATAYADDVLTFTAKVTKNGETESSGVTWSISGGDVTISEDGVLTVPSTVTHNTQLTVTATSKAANTVVGTYPVILYDGYERLKEITPGTLETIKIDGMRWFTLRKSGDDSKALIWAAQVIPGKNESYFWGSSCAGPWDTSVSRTYLNDEFLNSLTVLKSKAMETTFYTANDYSRSGYTETTDLVFLPSEADIFGTAGRTATSEVKEYTLGETGLIIDEGMRKAIDGEDSWLRSPGNSSSTMPQLQGGAGTLYFFQWSTKLRPAMWVDITG